MATRTFNARKHANRMCKTLNTIPTEIKVGPWVYQVFTHEKSNPDRELWGLCDRTHYQIHLFRCGDMHSPAYVVGVLFHELFHAIFPHLGLHPQRTDVDDKPFKTTEENIVYSFELALLQLLVDNPELLEWVRNSLRN